MNRLSREWGRLFFFVAAIVIYSAPAVTCWGQSKRISLNATLTPIEKNENAFKLTVDFELADGWHVYAELPADNPSPATELTLELPDGIQQSDPWQRPIGVTDKKDPLVKILHGKFQFACQLAIKPLAESREIIVKARYQVCNEKLCHPPKTSSIKVVIPASTMKQATAVKVQPTFANQFYEAPVLLMVGKTPLNEAAEQMYPSPALYDVDQDGAVELVVGDISGSLNVYEDKNKSGGDPVWSNATALKNKDGEAIEVDNW